MYVPPHNAVEDRAWALDLISEYPFGVLVTSEHEYPRATHLPMIAQERGDHVWILGHLARANPQADAIFASATANAIFQGPHAYVSPRWYEDPNHEVPTWNYLAVHCYGRLRECAPRPVVELLVAKFETGNDRWSFDRVDAGYAEKQLRGIVAFEMRVEELYAKAKLGQNRSAVDQARVAKETGMSPNLALRQAQGDKG